MRCKRDLNADPARADAVKRYADAFRPWLRSDVALNAMPADVSCIERHTMIVRQSHFTNM